MAKPASRAEVERLRRTIAAAPSNAEAHRALADLLLALNASAEAAPVLDALVRLRPGPADAWRKRGYALEMLGRFTEAEASYREAIGRAPTAELGERLGATLLPQERRDDAAAAFRDAATRTASIAHAARLNAYALLAEGHAEAAEAALRHAVALDPTDATAQGQLGQALAEAGDAVGAEAAFAAALAREPRKAGRWYDRVRTRRLTEADRPLLDAMRQAAAQPDLHPLERVRLGLAIAKALDDLGAPAEALAAALEANRLKGRLRPLDRTLILKRVNWAIRHFGTAPPPAGASASTRPILILGLPRSGTTLVESILACHPAVGAAGEQSFWSRESRGFAERDALPDAAALRAIAQDYLRLLATISARAHVTDKKPDNFFWAGFIHRALPQARIIHCRRDARDIAVSMLLTYFAPRPDFSTEPADLAFYIQQYARLMAHWRAVLPAERFLELDYEELVATPEAAIRRLLAFCGLPWDAACLHPERDARRISSASLWQVRQPISGASIGRWKRYAPLPEPLSGLGQG